MQRHGSHSIFRYNRGIFELNQITSMYTVGNIHIFAIDADTAIPFCAFDLRRTDAKLMMKQIAQFVSFKLRGYSKCN